MRIAPFDKEEITGICVIEQTMFINITKRVWEYRFIIMDIAVSPPP